MFHFLFFFCFEKIFLKKKKIEEERLGSNGFYSLVSINEENAQQLGYKEVRKFITPIKKLIFLNI